MTEWLTPSRELDWIVAQALGWKLQKRTVTADDPAWRIYKSTRGPKWFVNPPWPVSGIWLRNSKEEALADIPPYSTAAALDWAIHRPLLRPGITDAFDSPLALCRAFLERYG